MAKLKPLPTRYPKAAAAAYARALVELIKEMHAIYYAEFQAAIKPEMKAYRPDSFREDGPLGAIAEALERAKAKVAAVFTPQRMRNTAKRWLDQINIFNRTNLGDQIKRVRGLDTTQIEPWIDDFLTAAITENVSYISTIPQQYHSRISAVIQQGVKNGQRIPDMTAEIRKVYKVSENQARFIAVDQTSSITGQLTERRHRAAGVTKFVWRTSEDERVRESHKDFNGKTYEYSEGAGPKKLKPGQDFRCRCTAEPVFD